MKILGAADAKSAAGERSKETKSPRARKTVELDRSLIPEVGSSSSSLSFVPYLSPFARTFTLDEDEVACGFLALSSLASLPFLSSSWRSSMWEIGLRGLGFRINPGDSPAVLLPRMFMCLKSASDRVRVTDGLNTRKRVVKMWDLSSTSLLLSQYQPWECVFFTHYLPPPGSRTACFQQASRH